MNKYLPSVSTVLITISGPDGELSTLTGFHKHLPALRQPRPLSISTQGLAFPVNLSAAGLRLPQTLSEMGSVSLSCYLSLFPKLWSEDRVLPPTCSESYVSVPTPVILALNQLAAIFFPLCLGCPEWSSWPWFPRPPSPSGLALPASSVRSNWMFQPFANGGTPVSKGVSPGCCQVSHPFPVPLLGI